LATAFDTAVRRLGGGPTKRLELTIGSTPWVSGTISRAESSLIVRIEPDWLRRVGLPRLANTDDRGFVVAVEPRRVVVGWRPSAGGRWTAELVEAG
jgi:hypothetical protein